jgi:hypothetical protein
VFWTMSQIHADLTRLMTLSDWRLCRRRRRRFLGGFRPSRHPNDRKETRIQQYIKSQMALFAFIGNFRRRPIQTASLRTCSTWTVFRSILEMPPHSFLPAFKPWSPLSKLFPFDVLCLVSRCGTSRWRDSTTFVKQKETHLPSKSLQVHLGTWLNGMSIMALSIDHSRTTFRGTVIVLYKVKVACF